MAAGANITYKLLYNGTVAMTGGQDPVGGFSLAEITNLLLAEDVGRIVITSDDPSRTKANALPSGVSVRDRSELADVQRELAAVEGVTVLIHDQACAAEKRRKRKRGTLDTPTTRVMINERICEAAATVARSPIVSRCILFRRSSGARPASIRVRATSTTRA